MPWDAANSLVSCVIADSQFLKPSCSALMACTSFTAKSYRAFASALLLLQPYRSCSVSPTDVLSQNADAGCPQKHSAQCPQPAHMVPAQASSNDIFKQRLMKPILLSCSCCEHKWLAVNDMLQIYLASVNKMQNAMLGCSIVVFRFSEMAVADGEGQATAWVFLST